MLDESCVSQLGDLLSDVDVLVVGRGRGSWWCWWQVVTEFRHLLLPDILQHISELIPGYGGGCGVYGSECLVHISGRATRVGDGAKGSVQLVAAVELHLPCAERVAQQRVAGAVYCDGVVEFPESLGDAIDESAWLLVREVAVICLGGGRGFGRG